MANRNTLSTHPARVRERIEASREEIADSLLALREGLRLRYDWRQALQRSPAVLLGAAFAVGFLVAQLTSRKRDRE